MRDLKSSVIDACRRRVDEGMPPAVCDTIVRLLRPSIRLLTQPGREGPPGGSRIGGLPDLPKGTPWPVYPGPPKPDARWEAFKGEPLAFLLQVNLAEVAPFDLGSLLPASGLLHFFYLDTAARFDEFPRHGEVVRVLYTPDGQRLLRHDPPPKLPQREVYRGFALIPQFEWTVLPPDVDFPEEAPNPNQEESDAWLDYCDYYDGLADEVAELQGCGPWHRPKHRMLGYPDPVQYHGYSPVWELLLQVDSDPRFSIPPPGEVRNDGPGMMWTEDAGRVYFGIGPEDLAARRFDAVWGYMEAQ